MTGGLTLTDPALLARSGVPATLLSTATAWWTPKQVSSGDMVDQGPNGRTMVDNGTVSYLNDGTHHYAELRVASSDYLAAADAADLDADAGPFSLVLSIKPQVSTTGVRILAAKRAGSALGYQIYMNGGVLSAAFDHDGAAAFIATAATLSVGTRYTAAAVRSGNTLRAVVDGTPGSGTTITAGSTSAANTEELRINRGSGATTSYADQDFYGAAWFKGVALTDAQTVTVGTELLAVALL